MFGTGKYLKDRAANARRSATTLRQLAESMELSIADRGVLLTAAAIVEGVATQTARLGKERKASEEKFERDIRAARAKIKPAIDALPGATVLDKVAVTCCIQHFNDHLLRALRDDKSPSDSTWSLNYWYDQAKNDIAASLAYAVVTKKVTVESVIADLVSKHREAVANTATIRIAERFESAIHPNKEAA